MLSSIYCVVWILLSLQQLSSGCKEKDLLLKLSEDNWPTLTAVKSQVPAQEQVVAVQGLISRLLPGRLDEFVVDVEPTLGPQHKDTFTLTTLTDGTLRIAGSSGVAAALGFNHYLKYYTFSQVEWRHTQLSVPSPLPPVNMPVSVTTNDRFHYNANVCTFGYSYVWYDWEKWQREIDWLALNGVNLPLAFVGQEIVLQKVFSRFLSVPQADLNAWFTGPAFLPWFRMGNIYKWAGPLSQNFLHSQVKLQQAVLARMRAFGMMPVLPAYSGHIPEALIKLYPNISVTKLPLWSHFNSSYSGTYYLNPTDPLYQEIGSNYIIEQTRLFGTNHLYNIDPWNEMVPTNDSLEYIASASQAILSSIQTFDPDAVWVLQAWMFLFDEEFWVENRTKAFLTGVPRGRMLVLDLAAEYAPIYSSLNSYYGQPFIWCMLHNFGGRMGIYGRIDHVNENSFRARAYPGSTMVGTGLTMEGTGTNYIIYDLMNEMHHRKKPVAITSWTTDYILRRYGFSDETQALRLILYSWTVLRETAFNCSSIGRSSIARQPSWTLGYKSKPMYNTTSMKQSVHALMEAMLMEPKEICRQSILFLHDVVDRWREMLTIVFVERHAVLKEAYAAGNLSRFISISDDMLELFDDLEMLTRTHADFLLGPWLEAATNISYNEHEAKQFRMNALAQLTVWGPSAEINDYGAKHWSGLLESYYKERWRLFFNMNIEALRQVVKFNQTVFQQKVENSIELPFMHNDMDFPVKSKGDTWSISMYLYKKYESFLVTELPGFI